MELGVSLRRAGRCIPKLSVTERAVYGASMPLVQQLSLNSNIVVSLTLKRPEGRAPTSRQLVDALVPVVAIQNIVEQCFLNGIIAANSP